MGKEENLEKLNRELQKDIKKECQIFCIMARVRKTLEQYDEKEKFSVLNFYCNWALHSSLDNTDKFKAIIEKSVQNMNELINFIDFEHFKKELSEFSKEHDLNKDLVIDLKKWINFRYLLFSILSDVPLKIKNSFVSKFSFIKLPGQNQKSINFTIDYIDPVKFPTIRGNLEILNY